MTFTITVSNAINRDTATGIEVVDEIPSGYSYQGDIAGGSSQDDSDPGGSGLIWTIDSLASGSSEILTFSAIILPTGNYVNAAGILDAEELDIDSVPRRRTQGQSDDTEDDEDFAAISITQVAVPIPGMNIWGLIILASLLLILGYGCINRGKHHY